MDGITNIGSGLGDKFTDFSEKFKDKTEFLKKKFHLDYFDDDEDETGVKKTPLEIL